MGRWAARWITHLLGVCTAIAVAIGFRLLILQVIAAVTGQDLGGAMRDVLDIIVLHPHLDLANAALSMAGMIPGAIAFRYVAGIGWTERLNRRSVAMIVALGAALAWSMHIAIRNGFATGPEATILFALAFLVLSYAISARGHRDAALQADDRVVGQFS